MARKKVEKRVPSTLEMYLACERLMLIPDFKECQALYNIIGGNILSEPIDVHLLMDLRRSWLKVITMGLTEEERNELVNTKG